MTWLCSCTAGYEADPLVEFSTDVVVTGSRAHTVTRQLDAGVCPRHGLFRMVVRLEAPARLRLTLDSSDVRGWKGAAAVRFLRWPRTAADASASQRLLGFEALGTANELIARGKRAVEKRGGNAHVSELHHLVLHERYERRYD